MASFKANIRKTKGEQKGTLGDSLETLMAKISCVKSLGRDHLQAPILSSIISKYEIPLAQLQEMLIAKLIKMIHMTKIQRSEVTLRLTLCTFYHVYPTASKARHFFSYMF